ncbi:hypothetical protein [Sulfuricaulis sp.]|jgi:hypothetical protein|uniref:hypothetical protein n=1 Tax=Sulfuricaulis sp. TaxID=2003553 RepID=UPI00355946CF
MIMNKYVIPVVSMLCATLLPVPHQASAATDGETSIIVGAEYTSGDYGTSSKTKIWYFPVTLRYETDVNAASVTVSYLSVEGRGDVVVSGGGGGMGMGSQTVQRTSTLNGTRTNSGFGDVILTGSHKLSGTASSRIDLTGKIKLGTADETDNLGTGENDYAAQLDFEQNYNSNSVFGSAGYKIFGDPPGTDYKNVFYGSIGFSHKLDAALAAGLVLDAQQAALSGGSGQSELTLFLNNKIDKKTRLTGYFLKGFANGSPDWGLGVTLKLIL